MAWVHFCTANHKPIGRQTLVDMADWFEAGLLELGHKVTFSDQHLESGAINLLWDYFTPRFTRELLSAGVTYGLIATEIPDGVGFNWRTEPEWQSRFDCFQEAAKGASFIWAQIECTMPFYSTLAPSTFTALGFSERLVPSYVDQVPDRDFCFFGQKTPYREEAIGRLRRHATVEWSDKMLSPEGVGRLIARSRIGISLKQSPQWPVPSPPRLGRLMLAKRGVAAEHVPIPTEQGLIAGLCPEDRDFVDYALELLDTDWRKRAEDVFETYKARMPMKRIMEQALDTSVASLPRSFRVPTSAEETVDIVAASKPVAATPEPDSPELLGQIRLFNIIGYAQMCVGVPIGLGPFDLTIADLKDHPLVFETKEQIEHHFEAVICPNDASGIGSGPNEIREIRDPSGRFISIAFTSGPLLATSRENLEAFLGQFPDYARPTLIGRRGSYNLVQFADRVLALPLALGPIEPIALDLVEIPFIFRSSRRLEAGIDKLLVPGTAALVGHVLQHAVVDYLGGYVVLPAGASVQCISSEALEADRGRAQTSSPVLAPLKELASRLRPAAGLYVVQHRQPPQIRPAESLQGKPLAFTSRVEAERCLALIDPEQRAEGQSQHPSLGTRLRRAASRTARHHRM